MMPTPAWRRAVEIGVVGVAEALRGEEEILGGVADVAGLGDLAAWPSMPWIGVVEPGVGLRGR